MAGNISKFGVPLKNNREKLTEAFTKYPWLCGVDLHIGSQGMPIHLLVEGVKRIMDFVLEVNRSIPGQGKKKKINIFDMGGGLVK